ncbi:fatty acid hydroxylase superfamily-domain-containing protein [Trichophaea hybrida]|nr:fatty acid hydroxylase superfamily-domain-containing protein [Trichophaea hybrida]
MTMTMNSTLLHPTLTPQPPLLPPITDHWVLLILPIVTYWSLSLFFHFLDTHDLLTKYRLHTPEEVLARNHVTRREVVRDVILQQIIQTIVGGVTALWEGVDMVGAEHLEVWACRINGLGLEEKIARGIVAAGGDEMFLKVLQFLRLEGHQDWRWSVAEIVYWYMMPVVRLWVAIFILDTWQYFMHRAMHESKWLYKTFHSRHHRLYVPYAFGALYNHPLEGLLMDTIGAGLGYKLSGMGTRGAMFFFCFSTLKTVDDHCGYSLPWDPLQKMFWNNAGYHDVHHQTWGIKVHSPTFLEQLLATLPHLLDRWLGTQWLGGDASARRAASRERAALAKDAALAPLSTNGQAATNGFAVKVNGHATNGQANGYATTETPGKANGKVNGTRRVPSEEVAAPEETELRRSTRRRVKTRAT